MSEKKMKVVFHIKTEKRNGEEKSFWNRIGRAFVNKDNSLSLFLDYIPVGLQAGDSLNIRDYVPKEKTEKESFSE